MKLFLTRKQSEKLMEELDNIFNIYIHEYDEKEEILTISLPLYDDVDYTQYMKDLKASDRLQFAIDAINYAI